MKNLAGVKDCDKDIRKELTKAKVEIKEVHDNKSEVPYTLIGVVGDWELRRLWYYWSARPIKKSGCHGLPLDVALKLHNKKYPSEMFDDCDIENYGDVVRAGGHAGGISPDDYVGQPIYNAELVAECKALGIETHSLKSMGLGDDETEHPKLNYGEMAKLCNEGKIKAKRYVNCYHIDTQEGLNEFVRCIKAVEY